MEMVDMKRIKLNDEGGRMRLLLSMMLLVFLATTLTGAAQDNVTLGQINKNLSNVNETVTYINATALPPILPMEDVVKIILLLAIIAFAGLIVLRMVLPKIEGETEASSLEVKCEEVGRVVIIALVFLVLILAAILVKDSVISAGTKPTVGSIWAAIIILAIVFLLLIYLGFAVDGTLDQGEMRRAIAGTFVLGFTMLIFFLARYDIANKDVVTAYLQMVGVIVGFYFGAKTALEGTSSGSSEGLAIEYVEVNEEKKKITLTIRNKGENEIRLDKVYISGKGSDDKDFAKDFTMGVNIAKKTSIKMNPLELDMAAKPGSQIKIKVVADTGLADEKEHRLPE